MAAIVLEMQLFCYYVDCIALFLVSALLVFVSSGVHDD